MNANDGNAIFLSRWYVVAIVANIVVIGTALWLGVSLSENLEARRSLRSDKMREIQAIDIEVEALKRQVAAKPVKSNANVAKAPEASTPPRPDYVRPSPLLVTRPDVARMLAKTEIWQRFSSIFNTMGLSPDQIARIEEVLGASRETSLQAIAIAENDYRREPERYETVLRDAQEKIRETLTASLGAEVASKVDETFRTQALSEVVRSLAVDSFYTNEAFGASQSSLVINALVEAAGSQKNKVRIDLADIDWNRAIADVRRYLSASQVAVLEFRASQAKFEADYYRVVGELPPRLNILW